MGSSAKPTSGCTDLIACNYNENAAIDDGSYIYLDSGLPCNSGCSDETACNYSSIVNYDDGSCEYPNGCNNSCDNTLLQ